MGDCEETRENGTTPATDHAEQDGEGGDGDSPQMQGGKKQKKKKTRTTKEASTSSDAGPLLLSHKNKIRESLDAIAAMSVQNSSTAAKDMDEAKKHKYQFWDTQPVPKIDEDDSGMNEAIEPDRDASEIREEPYSLPAGFQWVNVNIDDTNELIELYTLLNENYVEDDDHMFRFDYSPEFLKWALKPPGWLPQWHCGVRAKGANGKLLAFIGAVPCTIRVLDKVRPMVEINFLCVHKRLRAKRVAPVLIREITRRVNQQGIFQAVFTAGIIIPKPVATCRYWHRPLNPKKLIDVGFSYLSRNMTMQRTLKLYKLNDEPLIPGFRQMTLPDIPSAYRLLTDYLKGFDIVPMFTVEEFTHFFMPRPRVIDSYVVERDGVVTDFASFYTLPSSVMNHSKYKDINAAYAFFNVAASVTWEELMTDALVMARKNDYDVFNALDLMDNEKFLKKLKFGIGDGNLQYYLYNWRCPSMNPAKIGLVLQ